MWSSHYSTFPLPEICVSVKCSRKMLDIGTIFHSIFEIIQRVHSDVSNSDIAYYHQRSTQFRPHIFSRIFWILTQTLTRCRLDYITADDLEWLLNAISITGNLCTAIISKYSIYDEQSLWRRSEVMCELDNKIFKWNGTLYGLSATAELLVWGNPLI